MSGNETNTPSLRLDKWLWFARFCKTRSTAQKLIERGQVTVNSDKKRKVSANVHIGDVVVVVLGTVKRTLTVRAMADRRGPADEARVLYEELTLPERLHGLDAGLPLHKPVLVRLRGAGRPTKKDRRAIAKHMGRRCGDV